MLLASTENTYTICHSSSFSNIKTSSNDKIFKLNPNLFKIQKEYNKKLPKFPGKIVHQIAKIASEVALLYSSEVDLTLFSAKNDKDQEEKDNKIAIETATEFYKLNDFTFPNFKGENKSKFAVVTEIDGIDSKHKFIFPEDSQFICGDVFNNELFDDVIKSHLFDLIIMDPPWRNKFIRRRKRSHQPAGYQQVDTVELTKIPINKMLKDEGILVVWCTNSKSHIDQLCNELFKHWGVQLLAQWQWLKVTTSGRIITPFNKQDGKQPFETIFIAQKNTLNKPTKITKNKLVVSIPSAINSHKPPLHNILESHFQKPFTSKCELFARYLQPGYFSIGNQVVKLQHEILFV